MCTSSVNLAIPLAHTWAVPFGTTVTNATLKKGMLMSGSHIDPVSLVYVTGRGVTGSYGSTIFVSEEMNIYNMYICVCVYIYLQSVCLYV